MARNAALKKVIAEAARLADEDLAELARWLADEQAARAAGGANHQRRGGAVGKERRSGVTYRHEMVTCGKPGCHCMTGGALHGPYWYSYKHEGGRMKKVYIGKNAPPELDEVGGGLRANRDNLSAGQTNDRSG